MIPISKIRLAVALALAMITAGTAGAQQPPATASPAPATPLAPTGQPAPQPAIEPAALAILKAMSEKLATAKTISFTAVSTYESPAINGQPLYYTTTSQVTVQRPDKLRVVTPGDGPPTEFYYDGKTMIAYDPAMKLAAMADAPPTIDAMVKAAYDKAAIYFPFVDFIVADPYKDIAETLKSAFVVGRSDVIGGTLTDMVAVASDTVQAEIWIGVADKLPRMMRAVYPKEPGNKRYEIEFSNWRLNDRINAGAFALPLALKAPRIEFKNPDMETPQKP
ncbi:MAG TPA: DUF2092 domain-containing protein [Stellaceae bacterium]|nr:DUF2092 domain-containing protein [Stellaceae bacterium]